MSLRHLLINVKDGSDLGPCLGSLELINVMLILLRVDGLHLYLELLVKNNIIIDDNY